ncbi:hypothetical protein M409DRAFT_24254 [Zasmidium cellare ATCC 36951]|uniref:Uncharacterized protein n=1 Tax=Zasmidium cellare ATCC 36951 TaxID=1080233 RepID=A0A6A6CDX0_ZASCE|nr:uncharacterized protein M409DRAFT_24254 [Zasmidium cellare ATCC 36951]KAF2165404.1 hypothetical protein M409DRAFT_24254 [Zasmidium cellare ATCC 36951]
MSSRNTNHQSTLPAYTQSNTASQSQDQLPAYSEATHGRSPVHVTDEKKSQQPPKKSKFAQIKDALKSIPLEPETPSGSNAGIGGREMQMGGGRVR